MKIPYRDEVIRPRCPLSKNINIDHSLSPELCRSLAIAWQWADARILLSVFLFWVEHSFKLRGRL